MIIETQSRTEQYWGYYTATIDEDHHDGDPWYHDSFAEISSWCINTFGNEDLWGSKPKSGWKRMRNKFFFDDESKLNLFVLRWA